MLQELINKAQGIEATTDANISGAVIQVTKKLDFDDLTALYTEVATTPKKLQAKMDEIEAARNGSEWVTIHDLRDGAANIIINRIKRG